MVDKVTLGTITSFVNDTTAANVFNNNMALITTAMDNTLSRDGTVPNQMGATLDMNNNPIINLPAPGSATAPARLVDIVSNPTLLLTVPTTGTSGHNVPYLDTSVTWSAGQTQTFNSNVTLTLNPVFTTGALQFAAGPFVGVNKSPACYLDIKGATTANTANMVRMQAFQASYSVLNNASTQNYFWGIDDSDSNKFKMGAGAEVNGGTPYLTMLSSGFFAINSIIPTSSDRLLIEDNTGASQLKVRFTGKSGVQLLQSTTGACTFNVIDNNSLLIGTNNVIQATLFPSGGFGIGNASSDPGVNNIGAIGAIKLLTTTATPAGGSLASIILGTVNIGIFHGSGVPTVSATQGSLYLRTDGSSTSTRLYINTNGSTTWTNVTTAA